VQKVEPRNHMATPAPQGAVQGIFLGSTERDKGEKYVSGFGRASCI